MSGSCRVCARAAAYPASSIAARTAASSRWLPCTVTIFVSRSTSTSSTPSTSDTSSRIEAAQCAVDRGNGVGGGLAHVAPLSLQACLVYPLRVWVKRPGPVRGLRCEMRRRSPPRRRRDGRGPCPSRRSRATRRRWSRCRPARCTYVRPRRRDRARADERVLLPLAPDRRLVRVAGQHARVVRQRHEDVSRIASSPSEPATDGVAKQRVTREAKAPTTNDTPSSECPGVASDSMRRPPVSTGPDVISSEKRSTSSSLPAT